MVIAYAGQQPCGNGCCRPPSWNVLVILHVDNNESFLFARWMKHRCRSLLWSVSMLGMLELTQIQAATLWHEILETAFERTFNIHFIATILICSANKCLRYRSIDGIDQLAAAGLQHPLSTQYPQSKTPRCCQSTAQISRTPCIVTADIVQYLTASWIQKPGWQIFLQSELLSTQSFQATFVSFRHRSFLFYSN